MNDADVLRYTLDWTSTNHYAITTSQILTELISVARQHAGSPDCDAAMHAAARRLEARDNELALSGSAF
ncbi:hypothetical protein OG921_03110 [Aldersonia sp. NBC_00410]|uniref:hypothetical protein n=1 Tax=Aldersonia sp. NBC_00410 TaxID=2975954 RepID=UPI00224C97CB|nr:hypothetical protein [Aldersonia sp. NBC_00410]MCX5042180.1 hypothetical protein [Aldersonia sp. NBC_00410]